MSSKKAIKKYFQFNSGNKNYLLSLKDILNDNNQEKLFIKLSLIFKDSRTDFYFEKTLLEIHNEYKELKQFLTIESLVEYFSQLIKHNKIKISLVNNFIYNIIFLDNEKNIFIKFLLRRKMEANEKIMEELSEQMVKMYKQMENMNNEIRSQNWKYEILQENYNNLSEKYEELKKVKSKEEINIPINNNVNDDLRRSSIKNIKELEKSINRTEKDKEENSFYNSKKSEEEQEISRSIDSFCCGSSCNTEIGQSLENNSKNSMQNILNQSCIQKENNCQILFRKTPSMINDKRNIMDLNSNEKCEIFTAFNNNHNVAQPIIAWVTKNENKKIHLQNWANKNYFELENAHNSKIDMLQYFCNENIGMYNTYIISLSINDKDTLKIWNIDLIDFKLKFIKAINKKIFRFCMISNKINFKDIIYLIAYTKNNNQKNIYIYKLDNDFIFLEKEDSSPKIECINEVNFLDFFYRREKSEYYLINCNNYDVNIIFQPFENDNNFSIKSYKKANCHLNAFIFENNNNNNFELFEANIDGIFIWDLNNNNSPIKEIHMGPVFDMCLWNEEYLWASTNEGFKLIQIEEENIEKTIDKDSKVRNGSKIRKINSPDEGESIVGIDSNRILCLWTL